MSPVGTWTCTVIAVAALTAGCGSSGAGTTAGGGAGTDTGTTAGAASSTTHDGAGGLSRGAKGEDPLGEAATTLHLSRGDCEALRRVATTRLGRKLTAASTPSPPLSRCTLHGSGAEVNVFLDTAHGAAQRYKNRIEETVQFNGENPAGLPHPVANVGERSYMNSSASWIPALGSLLAVRGDRWLTVTIAVTGAPGRVLRDDAATLARAGFKLSATG